MVRWPHQWLWPSPQCRALPLAIRVWVTSIMKQQHSPTQMAASNQPHRPSPNQNCRTMSVCVLPITHTHTLTHTQSLTHSHTLSHTLTHTLTHSLTHSHTHSLTHTNSHTLTHTYRVQLAVTNQIKQLIKHTLPVLHRRNLCRHKTESK